MNPEILIRIRRDHASCANWSTLFILALLGRAGTAGRTTDELMEAAALPRSTVLGACRRLASASLASRPGKTASGNLTRHTITAAGFAVLTAPALSIPTMKPLCPR